MTTPAVTAARPAAIADSRLKLAAVLGFAAITALAAQISIPLPGGVPLTLQTLAVALAATTLGPRLGLASMALYLLAGGFGLPVYSGGGEGWTHFAGQTGGFLLAFLLVQPLMGALSRRGSNPGWARLFAIALLGHAFIFAIGVPWYKAATGFTWETSLNNAFLPFILGTFIKCGIVAIAGAPLTRWARSRGW